MRPAKPRGWWKKVQVKVQWMISALASGQCNLCPLHSKPLPQGRKVVYKENVMVFWGDKPTDICSTKEHITSAMISSCMTGLNELLAP